MKRSESFKHSIMQSSSSTFNLGTVSDSGKGSFVGGVGNIERQLEKLYNEVRQKKNDFDNEQR